MIDRQDAELTRRVSKETNLPLTVLAVFTCLRPVPRRVQPALENSVSKLTAVTAAAAASAIVCTDCAGVVIAARITAPCLFAGMCKRAVGPVVTAAAGAAADLELEHAEVVRGVGVVGGVIIVVGGSSVVGEEFAEEGLVGSREAWRVGGAIHVRGGG